MQSSDQGARQGWLGWCYTPLRIALIVSAALVLADIAVMRLLGKVSKSSSLMHYALDSGLTLLLSLPALYFFVLRPLLDEIRKRQLAEAELHAHRETLERKIQERTHELRNSNAQLEAVREDLTRAQAVARTGNWRLDVRQNILVWSDETYRIFGVQPGTPLTYEFFLGQVHPEDRDYVDKAWKAALAGGSYDIEHRVQVGPAVRWLREKAELEFDPDGRFRGGFGTVQDITELKQAQESLKRELALKEAVAELFRPMITEGTIEKVAEAVSDQARKLTSSPHCLVTSIDPGTRNNICYAFTDMMPASRTVMKSERLVFAVGSGGRYPGIWGTVLNSREAFLSNQPSHRHPAARGLPEGHIPINRLLAVPVVLGEEVLGEILLANSPGDYTEHDLLAVRRLATHYGLAIQRLRYKQALDQAQLDLENKVEQRTADLNASLQALNVEIEARRRAEMEREELTRLARAATVDQFAASLAHELRQPLTAIMSNAEAAEQFLEQQPPNLEEVKEALHDILNNDERASEVIRRLRALYRKTGSERADLDLNKLIEDTLELLRSELIFRKISWQLELHPNLPEALGNRIEIQQVVLNLVLNAADAMAEAETRGRQLVISTFSEAAGCLEVAVRDSGIGFAPESAEKLFEPFFTTKATGMGMGLTLCRSIVRAHGGRLWCENHPEGGAVFHFTIPLSQKAKDQTSNSRTLAGATPIPSQALVSGL